MPKRAIAILVICLVAATAAQAQRGGGGGRGRGSGGDRGAPPSGSAPTHAAKAFSQPEIIGVVKAIDIDAGRLTIAYEPVEALNWPAGAQPFPVSKSALLKDVTVGEKVRFTLESQEIAAIRPF